MSEYEIKRSKRKTIAIHITSDGNVEVRSPFNVSKATIDEFVKSKENWIKKHTAAIKSLEKTPLKIGGNMLFLGKEFPIRENKEYSYFDGKAIYIQKGADIYAVLAEFYRIKAKTLIPTMVHAAERRMGLCANRIGITSAKTRWGSCSGKNSLYFTYLLMMAEPEAIEYVVVHELAHIKEKNHSRRFWAIVAEYEPDYNSQKEQLRQLALRLNRDGWK